MQIYCVDEKLKRIRWRVNRAFEIPLVHFWADVIEEFERFSPNRSISMFSLFDIWIPKEIWTKYLKMQFYRFRIHYFSIILRFSAAYHYTFYNNETVPILSTEFLMEFTWLRFKKHLKLKIFLRKSLLVIQSVESCDSEERSTMKI